MTRFCTYFDGRYAPRGLVMLRSLAEVFPFAEVTVLALDERAAAIAHCAPPGVRVVPLDALLQADAALRVAKSAQAERGWLMALKPAWLAFALAEVPLGKQLTYVDADMYFLASPQEALADVASASITISPQRFNDPRRAARWGRFNAGWIGVRHDATAKAFLDAWRRDCDGRMSPTYSNQKFLDRVAETFPNTRVLDHPGVNLAHWNVATTTIHEQRGRVFVDGRPLVAYHMAGLLPVGFTSFVTGLTGTHRRGLLRRRVYESYLDHLRLAARDLGLPVAHALDRIDWPRRLMDRMVRALVLGRLWVRGGVVRL